MNHKPSGLSMLLGKALEGFLILKSAEGLATRTLASYETTLKHWSKHMRGNRGRKNKSQNDY